eukprot:gene35428-43683_t
MTIVYQGSVFEEWVEHFRLSADLKSWSVGVGVIVVEDLLDVYTDSALLAELTKVLIDLKAELPNEFAALISAFAPPQVATSLPGKRKLESLEDTERQLKELQAELKATTRKLSAVETKKEQAKAQAEETKKRKGLIADLQAVLRVSASLDVVFVLDTTGSMRDYIDAARDNMRDLVDGLAKIYPDIPLRVAFVGYKDHRDYQNRLSVLRFTNSL